MSQPSNANEGYRPRRADTVENYHGTPVPDPYRWLEDPDDPETAAFLEAQNAATARYLATLPGRKTIRERLRVLWNFPRTSPPNKAADHYFYTANSGLQNQAILYTSEGLDDKPRILLDPNTLSPDATVALSNYAPSKDGSRLAYALSTSGSDWHELRVRDMASGDDLPGVVRWSRFSSMAWLPDGSGYYYARYPEPGSVAPEDTSNYSRVYLHRVGTEQEEDALIYERPDAKELGFDPLVTEDGAYLVLTVWHGTDNENRLYYRPLNEDLALAQGEFVRLLDAADAAYHFLGNVGTVFYLWTDLGAPRGRVIALDLREPGREHWREVVPERADVIADGHLVHGELLLVYMRDAAHVLERYSLDGAHLGSIPLPALGTVALLTGKPADNEMFFTFTSYLFPPTVYRYDFVADTLSSWHAAPPAGFDPAEYETWQEFYPSKDGTRIPLFLTAKRGLPRDGQRPTLLYGYGGFTISLTPSYTPSTIFWLEQGGIYAVANLRGGGEYGEEWHRAGMLERKQTVFDDFIAAGEHLIAQGYTSSARLAIMGGSNGGLLVAATMVQRPDLVGAVVCQVPVIDMLRYHRFTAGRFWTGEYGNAETNAEHFKFLYAYSPLHNARAGVEYPPTLITTADTDDRVVPSHARKFAATLQEAQTGVNPILLRVETHAGHGHGKPIAKQIDEATDVFAFLCEVMGIAVGR